jgi:hypothetical protein
LTPWTVPFQSLSASTERRWGSRIWKIGLPERSPIVSSEKLAPCSVLYRASAAAIFIGWRVSICLPWLSPKIIVATIATDPTASATLAEVAKRSRGSRLLRRSFNKCQALTPSTSMVEVTKAAKKTCRKALMSTLLVITAQKFVITALLPTIL